MPNCPNALNHGKMDPLEFKKGLELRLRKFAVSVFKFLDALPAKVSSRVISFQLGKSASSIGANYSEANRAESRDDFAHKVSIALKEAGESHYWLGILCDLYPEDEALSNLQDECQQLLRLLQSINRSVRTGSPLKSNNRTIEQSNNV